MRRKPHLSKRAFLALALIRLTLSITNEGLGLWEYPTEPGSSFFLSENAGVDDGNTLSSGQKIEYHFRALVGCYQFGVRLSSLSGGCLQWVHFADTTSATLDLTGTTWGVFPHRYCFTEASIARVLLEAQATCTIEEVFFVPADGVDYGRDMADLIPALKCPPLLNIPLPFGTKAKDAEQEPVSAAAMGKAAASPARAAATEQLTCEPGFGATGGDHTLRCRVDGGWEGELLRCGPRIGAVSAGALVTWDDVPMPEYAAVHRRASWVVERVLRSGDGQVSATTLHHPPDTGGEGAAASVQLPTVDTAWQSTQLWLTLVAGDDASLLARGPVYSIEPMAVPLSVLAAVYVQTSSFAWSSSRLFSTADASHVRFAFAVAATTTCRIHLRASRAGGSGEVQVAVRGGAWHTWSSLGSSIGWSSRNIGTLTAGVAEVTLSMDTGCAVSHLMLTATSGSPAYSPTTLPSPSLAPRTACAPPASTADLSVCAGSHSWHSTRDTHCHVACPSPGYAAAPSLPDVITARACAFGGRWLRPLAWSPPLRCLPRLTLSTPTGGPLFQRVEATFRQPLTALLPTDASTQLQLRLTLLSPTSLSSFRAVTLEERPLAAGSTAAITVAASLHTRPLLAVFPDASALPSFHFLLSVWNPTARSDAVLLAVASIPLVHTSPPPVLTPRSSLVLDCSTLFSVHAYSAIESGVEVRSDGTLRLASTNAKVSFTFTGWAPQSLGDGKNRFMIEGKNGKGECEATNGPSDASFGGDGSYSMTHSGGDMKWVSPPATFTIRCWRKSGESASIIRAMYVERPDDPTSAPSSFTRYQWCGAAGGSGGDAYSPPANHDCTSAATCGCRAGYEVVGTVWMCQEKSWGGADFTSITPSLWWCVPTLTVAVSGSGSGATLQLSWAASSSGDPSDRRVTALRLYSERGDGSERRLLQTFTPSQTTHSLPVSEHPLGRTLLRLATVGADATETFSSSTFLSSHDSSAYLAPAMAHFIGAAFTRTDGGALTFSPTPPSGIGVRDLTFAVRATATASNYKLWVYLSASPATASWTFRSRLSPAHDFTTSWTHNQPGQWQSHGDTVALTADTFATATLRVETGPDANPASALARIALSPSQPSSQTTAQPCDPALLQPLMRGAAPPTGPTCTAATAVSSQPCSPSCPTPAAADSALPGTNPQRATHWYGGRPASRFWCNGAGQWRGLWRGRCLPAIRSFASGGALYFVWTPTPTGALPLLTFATLPVKGSATHLLAAPVWVGTAAALPSQPVLQPRLQVGRGYSVSVAFLSPRGSLWGARVLRPLTKADMSLPGPPPQPLVSATTGGAFQLTLLPPLDTGGAEPFAELGSYSVAITEQTAPAVPINASLYREVYKGRLPACTVGRLFASTAYVVRVRALNPASACGLEAADGLDRQSAELEVTTTAATLPLPPSPPLLLSASGGALTLQLSWPLDSGGLPVTALHLTLAKAGVAVRTQTVASPPPTLTLVVALPSASTEYTAVYTATTALATTEPSEPLTASTTPPTPPGFLALTPVPASATGGAVTCSVALQDTGGEASFSIKLSLRAVGDDAWLPLPDMTDSPLTVVATHPTMLAATSYEIKAFASNSQGSGPVAATVTAVTTAASAPKRVHSIVTSAATASTVTLTWQPGDLGGSPLTRYDVFLASTAALLASTASTSVTVAGLQASSSQELTVVAVTAHSPAGGEAARVTVHTLPPTAPGTPSALRMTQNTGTAIHLAWEPPSDTGGLPLTYSLDVVKVNVTGAPFSAALTSPSPSIAHGQLELDTLYRYTVTAHNTQGQGAGSVAGTFTTLPTPSRPSSPDAPTITEVASALTVTWTKPDDGGSAILQYRLCATAGRNCSYSSCALESCSLSGLALPPPNGAVTFFLASRNAKGWSVNGSATQYVQPAEHGQAGKPVVHCYTRSTLDLTWPAAVVSGALTGYKVVAGGADLTPVVPSAEATVTGLTPAASLVLTVETVVESGSTIPSEPTSVTLLTDPGRRRCLDRSGTITGAASSFVWELAPDGLEAGEALLLQVTSFDLECDYASLTIEGALHADPTAFTQLFKGGCARPAFAVEGAAALRLTYTVDTAFARPGFVASYSVSAQAAASRVQFRSGQLPCAPCVHSGGGGGGSGGGGCALTCSCSDSAYHGEDCGSYKLCPAGAASAAAVCSMDPSTVVAVSPRAAAGGTADGSLPTPTKPGRPYPHLAAALARASADAAVATILLLPGQYRGAGDNCGLTLSGSRSLTLTTVRGSVGWDTAVSLAGFPVQEEVVFDCAAASRALTTALSAPAALTVEGARYTNCTAPTGDGGALLVGSAAAVTLRNCQLTGNSASAGDGGALAVASAAAGASLTLHGCDVSGNSAAASMGGGVAVKADATLTLSGATHIHQNRAAHGGGCAAVDTAAIVGDGSSGIGVSSAVYSNTATLGGGNVALRDAANAQSLFIARGTAPRGGGVHIVGPYATAAAAAAVAAASSSAPAAATPTLTDCAVVGNMATTGHGAGGGLYLQQGSHISLVRTVVDGNTAAGSSTATGGGRGGGACVEMGARLSADADSLFTRNSAKLGAAVAVASPAVLAAATLTNGSSTAQGWQGHNVTELTGVNVTGNRGESVSDGGGVHLEDAVLLLTACTLTANSAQFGAAVAATAPAVLHVRSSNALHGNRATGGGGGVLLRGSAVVAVFEAGATVNGNSASTGAHLQLMAPLPTSPAPAWLAEAEAVAAAAAAAPALSPATYSMAVVQGLRASAGTASDQGGGAYLIGAAVLLRCSFTGGSAGRSGGGLSLAPRTRLHTTDCSVTHNTAAQDGGGVAMAAGCLLHAATASGSGSGSGNDGLALSWNSAGRDGGALYASGAVSVTAVAVSNNTAVTRGGGVCVDALSSAAASAAAPPVAAFTAVTASHNHVTGSGGQGGGLYLAGVAASHRHVTLTRNSAAVGGNLYLGQAQLAAATTATSAASAAAPVSDWIIIWQNGGGSGALQATATTAAPSTAAVAVAASDGGNVAMSGASALSEASVSYGSAAHGGGIAVLPPTTAGVGATAVNISHCVCTHNLASLNGGGLFAGPGSLLSLRTVAVSNNSAGSGTGGGVALSFASLRFHSLSVRGNRAGSGGGLDLTHSTLTPLLPPLTTAAAMPAAADGVTLTEAAGVGVAAITHNLATQTGGGAVLSGAVAMQHVHVSDNAADGGRGGGVLAQPGSWGELHSVAIARNRARGSGSEGGGFHTEAGAGAAAAAGGSTCAAATAAPSDGGGGSGGAGGTVAPLLLAVGSGSGSGDSQSLSLLHCLLQRNTAARGAGLFVGRSARLRLTASALLSNSALASGGAAFVASSAALTAAASRLQFNTAEKYGGALYVTSAGSANVTQGSNVAHNGARYGGAAAVITGSLSVATGSVVSGNHASSRGGGLYVESESSVWLSHCLLSRNAAVHSAGALFLGRDSTALLTAAVLQHSRAASGGAVLVSDSILAASHSHLTYNTAVEAAGALLAEGTAAVTLTHSTVAHGSARRGGAAVAVDAASLSLLHCTVRNNSAAQAGGGVHCSMDSRCTLASSTLSFNSVHGGSGGAVFAELSSPASLNLTHPLFTDNAAGEGGAVYWQISPSAAAAASLPSSYRLDCSSCSFRRNRATNISTDAVTFMQGWFPTQPVGSGVQLVKNVSGSGGGGAAPVYPTLYIVDRYQQVSVLSNGEKCTVALGPSAIDSSLEEPTARAQQGVVQFSLLRVKAGAGAVVPLLISCASFDRPPLLLHLSIGPCQPGSRLSPARKCERCDVGSYSPHGSACWPCPDRDATCVESSRVVDEKGNVNTVPQGAVLPSTQPGRFLFTARDSELAAVSRDVGGSCATDPYPASAPHQALKGSDLTRWAVRVEGLLTPRQLICVTGQEMYLCPMGPAACPGGVSQRGSPQCATGYSGPLCANCQPGFYKTSAGVCNKCALVGSSDGAKTLYVIRMALAGVTMLAMLLFYVRPRPPRPPKHGRASHFTIVMRMMGRGGHAKLVRPEKVKILLAFAQVFNTMKDSYPRVWPPGLREFMQQFASANLDVVRMSGVECVGTITFYDNFLFMISAPLGGASLLALLSAIGRHYFNKQIIRFAPNCLGCGKLPDNRGVISHALVLKNYDGDAHVSRHKLSSLHLFSATHHSGCPAGGPSVAEGGLSGAERKGVMLENLHRWRSRCLVRMAAHHYSNKCFKILFWLLLLAYPAVSVKVLMLFHCKEVGNSWYLSRDYGLKCFTPRWAGYFLMGLLGIGIYVIGIPLLFFALLFQARSQGVGHMWKRIAANQANLRVWVDAATTDLLHRGQGIDRPETMKEKRAVVREYLRVRNMRFHRTRTRLGFIYGSYLDNRWWYEIVELFRKLLMNGVITFVHPGNPPAQLTAGLALATLSLALCLLLQPYERRGDQVTAVVALSQLVLTLFVGLILVGDFQFFSVDPQVESSVCTFIVILSNGAALLAVAVAFAVEIAKGFITARKHDDAQHRARSHSVMLGPSAESASASAAAKVVPTATPAPAGGGGGGAKAKAAAAAAGSKGRSSAVVVPISAEEEGEAAAVASEAREAEFFATDSGGGGGGSGGGAGAVAEAQAGVADFEWEQGSEAVASSSSSSHKKSRKSRHGSGKSKGGSGSRKRKKKRSKSMATAAFE